MLQAAFKPIKAASHLFVREPVWQEAVANRQLVEEIGQCAAERDLAQKERVQLHAEQDATERRITELYLKAADQLGSDKAPVRLAALRALERLAQGIPDSDRPSLM